MSDNTDSNILPQKALARIKAICAGNGANPDEITLISAKGKSYDCHALTHIELHSDVKTETKKGRHQVGAMVESFDFIDQEANNIKAGILKNNDTRKFLSDLLLKRPDKGFGLHDEHIDLEQFNRQFHTHEACKTCEGIGNTVCTLCHGQRQDVCNHCHGHGMIPCNFCGGNGQSQGSDGKIRTCTRCNGTRQISCPTCQRTGKIMCRQCKGSGTSTCNGCKGAAFLTQICRVQISLKTIFEFDRSHLPDPVTKFFQNKRTAGKTPKHVNLAIQPVRREDDGLAIEYSGQFPYGEIEFKIKDGRYKANIFGQHGKLIKAPPFLKKLIDGQLNILHKASQTSKQALPNLKKAMRSRFIEDAVQFTSGMKPEKAMRALKKKYPEGIDNKSIQKVIMECRKALTHATKNARWMGYGIGCAITIITNVFYFHQLHMKIQASFGQMTILPDLGVLVVNVLVYYALTTLFTRKKMASIIKKTPNVQPKRKAPINWFKLLGFATLSWSLAILITVFMLNQSILWLPL